MGEVEEENKPFSVEETSVSQAEEQQNLTEFFQNPINVTGLQPDELD